MNSFAERLRRARDIRQLTQAELARATGISQSAIANYENGNRKTTKHIFRLAHVLQVAPVWLADGIGSMDVTLSDPSPAGGYRNRSERQDAVHWPFRQVTQAQWNKLSEQDRALVETTLATMIHTLIKSAAKR